MVKRVIFITVTKKKEIILRRLLSRYLRISIKSNGFTGHTK